MALIGTIAVSIAAQTNKFSRGIRTARNDLRSFERRARNTARVVGGLARAFTGFAAVGGIAGLAAGIRKTAMELDEVAKTADRINVATEQLTGLRHAAAITGVETKTLTTGMERMVRSVSEAAQGTGEAVDTFKELGIEVKTLNTLSPDQQFMQLAGAIKSLTNQNDQLRATFDIFGRGGAPLLNTLRLGASGVNQLVKEAKELGVAFNREQLARVEKFNDEMTRLKTLMGGAFQGFVIDISPAATKAVIDLQDTFKGLREQGLFGTGKLGTALSSAKSAVFDNPFGIFGISKKIGEAVERRLTDERTRPGAAITGAERMAMIGQRVTSMRDTLDSISPTSIAQKEANAQRLGAVYAGKAMAKAFKKEVENTKHLSLLGRIAVGQHVQRMRDRFQSGMNRHNNLLALSGPLGVDQALAQATAERMRGPNAAINANTQEGFRALRSGMRPRTEEKTQSDILRQLLKTAGRRDKLLGDVVKAVAKENNIDLTEIP